MRKPALITTTACLLGLILAPSSRNGGAQTKTAGSAGPAPTPEHQTPYVNVFFGSAKALSLDEIRTQAQEALKSSGHKMEDKFHCVVNVMVDGKEPGCAVIFQDPLSNMLYTVGFDKTGQARVLYAGPVRHRTPKFGEPVPGVPEDAVRVK